MLMSMTEPKEGYEYLEMLRQQNGKQTQSFNAFSEYLEARARKQGIPIHGQFELTPLCNLNCRMCYVHLNAAQLRSRPLLTVEQWKDLIHQAFEGGMFQAVLTGGECLTYPGFDELYLYLHSLGCQVDILTNGILLNEERIRFFRKHPPALIQITLYGWDEESYEHVTGQQMFRVVRENILRVKEAGLPLLVTITPNSFLGEDVFETIRTARSFSDNVFINTSLFSPPEEPWRLAESDDPDIEFYAKILRFDKELRGIQLHERPLDELPPPGGCSDVCQERGLECGGGRSGFVISWKGEMRICNRLAPRSYPLRDGFDSAWRVIHEAAVSWPRIPACRGCAYETVCSRCAAEILKYGDPGNRPAALCERTRYMASRGILSFSECK